jgi:predicted SprT family Zn-dependent metalloprotease
MNSITATCGVCGNEYWYHFNDTKENPHDWQCTCGNSQTYSKNFDPIIREADIHCIGCSRFIRYWDPN